MIFGAFRRWRERLQPPELTQIRQALRESIDETDRLREETPPSADVLIERIQRTHLDGRLAMKGTRS